MLDLHRHLGGLAVVFVALHTPGILLDGWIGFGPAQLLVPFTGTWRPGAVAWGITAMYCWRRWSSPRSPAVVIVLLVARVNQFDEPRQRPVRPSAVSR